MDSFLTNHIYSAPSNIESFDYYYFLMCPLCNLLDFDTVEVAVNQYLLFHIDF
jgi:hypothetical protein